MNNSPLASYFLALGGVIGFVELAAEIKGWATPSIGIGSVWPQDLKFKWDEGNEYHIFVEHKERGYTKEIIESVFEDKHNVIVQEKTMNSELRYNILGKGLEQKIHVVVFCIRNNYIRPITAHIANKKLRQIYETQKHTPNRL